jgi:hypothetical protein
VPGGGNIKIQARNVNLAGQSILRAGIATGLGSPDSQGGDVTINATVSEATNVWVTVWQGIIG